MKISTIRKALLAYVLPFVGALGASMSDGDVTGPEVIVSIGVGLVTGTAVYSVPNARS